MVKGSEGVCFKNFEQQQGLDGKESACNAGDAGLIPGQKDPLEKRIAIHSSILAWRIPWTEKPAGLQFMESQRIGQNWATNTYTYKSLFRWSLTSAVSSLLSILGILNCNQWAQFLPGIQGLSDLQQWWAFQKLVYMPSVGDLKTMSPLHLSQPKINFSVKHWSPLAWIFLVVMRSGVPWVPLVMAVLWCAPYLSYVVTLLFKYRHSEHQARIPRSKSPFSAFRSGSCPVFSDLQSLLS